MATAAPNDLIAAAASAVAANYWQATNTLAGKKNRGRLKKFKLIWGLGLFLRQLIWTRGSAFFCVSGSGYGFDFAICAVKLGENSRLLLPVYGFICRVQLCNTGLCTFYPVESILAIVCRLSVQWRQSWYIFQDTAEQCLIKVPPLDFHSTLPDGSSRTKATVDRH